MLLLERIAYPRKEAFTEGFKWKYVEDDEIADK